MKSDPRVIGIGATDELRLRVSVATLVKVLFQSPEDGQTMLALEHIATLRQIEGKPQVAVIAQPLGGAVRLLDPLALKELIGNFHFDSEESQEEEDFRIQIHPASWETIKDICRSHLDGTEKGILDFSPQRELAEEFEDALHIKIVPDRYQLNPLGLLVKNTPTETTNVRVEKNPTVRVYFVFEAWIHDREIISMMLANSRACSDSDLEKAAWKDARQGGKGRANAILVIGLDGLMSFYRSIPVDRRGDPLRLEGHQLDETVTALLDKLDSPKYRR